MSSNQGRSNKKGRVSPETLPLTILFQSQSVCSDFIEWLQNEGLDYYRDYVTTGANVALETKVPSKMIKSLSFFEDMNIVEVVEGPVELNAQVSITDIEEESDDEEDSEDFQLSAVDNDEDVDE